MKLRISMALAAFLASTGLAQAGCDFFEHNDLGGASLALADGECAILAGNNTAGCEGLPAKTVSGWNDRISSVRLNHNSRAFLKQHGDGGGLVATVVGNRGVKKLDGFNDEASVILCRQ